MVAEQILQVHFLGVYVVRKPQIGLDVSPPAIKMTAEIAFEINGVVRGVNAVESDDKIFLIFRPNAAAEATLAGFGKRGHVEDDATNAAEEFPPDVIEVIMLSVEFVRVYVNH